MAKTDYGTDEEQPGGLNEKRVAYIKEELRDSISRGMSLLDVLINMGRAEYDEQPFLRHEPGMLFVTGFNVAMTLLEKNPEAAAAYVEQYKQEVTEANADEPQGVQDKGRTRADYLVAMLDRTQGFYREVEAELIAEGIPVGKEARELERAKERQETGEEDERPDGPMIEIVVMGSDGRQVVSFPFGRGGEPETTGGTDIR